MNTSGIGSCTFLRIHINNFFISIYSFYSTQESVLDSKVILQIVNVDNFL